ncbi:MAG: polyisoprenoid-binding protein [Ignavibacteriae bacterium]|jgi:polyisoprenoid-binding protein YceI|nr:MAG: polyisoprenoid-binding protein [Ignavibacteriota bacterium]
MANWIVDPLHTDVQFKVKHLMINTVTGEFGSFDVKMESEKEDYSDAKITFTAEIASISTKNEMRDNHLKSDDFFNAEKYPQMTFVSSSFTPKGGDTYALAGDLTIRDITKPVVLDVEYGGSMVDFYGNIKAGFEISGKINRKDFGLMWNGVTEAGGIVVSDDVRLHLNVQLQQVVGQEVTA